MWLIKAISHKRNQSQLWLQMITNWKPYRLQKQLTLQYTNPKNISGKVNVIGLNGFS